MGKARPFEISKHLFVEAWKRVKANKGAAGSDGVTIEDFEKDVKNNLYKIWNRMSSGSYFPPPVRTKSIPKKKGGERKLGIPCVSDRVAQMVAKLVFEPEVERIFHDDSYGYRPHRSALDAITVTRERCWKYDWILEFDIKGLFDTIPSDLIMKAVKHHTQERWLILYVQRWLQASIVDEKGEMVPRRKGVPQGGVISPLLSNLFMHYAFDQWMKRTYPRLPICRYADDGLVHCRTEWEAQEIRRALAERLRACGVELHPEKTRIVCCQPKNRKWTGEKKFDFLGYEFRPRLARTRKGRYFTAFTPGISPSSGKMIREKAKSMELWRHTQVTLKDIATFMNPVIQGWINYFGQYQRSLLQKTLRYINLQLIKWVKRKYRKQGKYFKRAKIWLRNVYKYNPQMFSHWRLGFIL